jgi:protein gp37
LIWRDCLSETVDWKPGQFMKNQSNWNSDENVQRIDHLKKFPGNVNKFLMLEPLLNPMPQLDLEGIGWVKDKLPIDN